MVECGRKTQNTIFSTSLYVIVSVFQLLTKDAAQGASISLDVSRLRINPLECYDRSKSCSKEAKNGFCVSNYHYMIDRCPWSCRFCRRARGDTDKCEDISDDCPEWVSKKECTTRPDFMAQNCKKSCEMCGPESEYKVSDSEAICPIWAKAGWCQKDSDLLEKCPHSCQKYGYMGANSLEERYITVNFQNTSQVTAPKFTEIVAPPPPSAAIRPHSDLESLPEDLRSVLEKEWWNSKLLQLTQKQNEYVTHPEARPLPLPLHQNQSALSGNNTLLGGSLTNGSQVLNNLASLQGFAHDRSSTSQAGNQQQQMNEPPAPAPPPRPYDSLLPQLAVSGLTWNGKTEKPEGDQVSEPMAQQNRSGADVVWKEEQEEDEDLDSETGQQKEEVPVIVSGNDENLSGEEPSVEVSSSGNEELMQGRNRDSVLKTSGENLENDDKNTVDQDTASSGSGEADESENHHVAMYSSPESGQEEEEEGVRQVFPENEISGSGQVSTQEIDDSDASSPENGQVDYVGQGSPKNSISRSGQFKKQESDDIESSLSGSGQYEEGETFSGSGE